MILNAVIALISENPGYAYPTAVKRLIGW